MKPASFLGLVVLIPLLGEGAKAGNIFSSGETTPETISAVPAGFNSALAGSYLVPDPLGPGSPVSDIWDVPANGGPPAPFTIPLVGSSDGGTFLPGGFGSLGGLYLVTNYSPAGTLPGPIHRTTLRGRWHWKYDGFRPTSAELVAHHPISHCFRSVILDDPSRPDSSVRSKR